MDSVVGSKYLFMRMKPESPIVTVFEGYPFTILKPGQNHIFLPTFFSTTCSGIW